MAFEAAATRIECHMKTMILLVALLLASVSFASVPSVRWSGETESVTLLGD